MNYPSIRDLNVGEKIDGFFLVKNATLRQASNGKDYLDISLSDQSGEVNGKKWTVNEADVAACQPAKLVKIRADVTDYKGQMQLRIERVRPATEEDGVSVGDFVQSAPETHEAMYRFIQSTVAAMKDEDIQNIVSYLLERFEPQFVTYPGAVKNHHSVRSGLLYHTKSMLASAVKLTEVYTELNRDLLYAGVILHDIGKILEIEASDLGLGEGFTRDGQLLGHIIQGILLIKEAGEAVAADEEKVSVLEHMILSHHNNPEYGSPKYPMLPEAEMLHHLDILDARMYDILHAKESTAPGTFSDRLYTMENRRIYHTMFDEKE